MLTAVLRRIEAVNPVLNLFAHLDAAGAAAQAARSDARFAAQAPLGPLDGVVLTIKDNITVAGLPCGWGTAVFQGYVPDADELPVARLRAQGAVILGKTTVSEFTLGRGTVSTPVYGTTRNPWNPLMTTGASSGGSSACVASGIGAGALGTDGGGSIRRPASHCGVVGLKPSTGRVARTDGLPVILHDCEVIGPIARTVRDVAMLYRAIGLPHPADRLSWPFMRPDLPEKAGPLRILFVPRFGDHPVHPDVAAAAQAAAGALAALGHRVETGPPPFDTALHESQWPVLSAAGLAWLLRDRDWRGRIAPAYAAIAEMGAGLTAGDYVDALAAFRETAAQMGRFFETYDLLMTPAAGAPPWTAEDDAPDGERAFTGFVNAAGLPGITVPAPGARDLPIGVQIVAPFGAEERLLAVAAAYEAANPWAARWPEGALAARGPRP